MSAPAVAATPKKENVGMFLAARMPRPGLEKSRAPNHWSEAANPRLLMSQLEFDEGGEYIDHVSG